MSSRGAKRRGDPSNSRKGLARRASHAMTSEIKTLWLPHPIPLLAWSVGIEYIII
jgi:hypothetical protein